MSRSGYNDDIDQWALIRWRGAVASAIKGKRGQAFLWELLDALDALPEKKLVAQELEMKDGAVCALGAVGRARGFDMAALDPDDIETVAGTFGLPDALTREIVFENDDFWHTETPEQRFSRMRNWVASQIKEPRTTTVSRPASNSEAK